tara:strand:- start:39543 stop:39839 length:297 start_codon:yes stop_codon:yes gene_type:complete
MTTKLEKAHMNRVARLGCCVCRRLDYGFVVAQVHHIALGSGKRSPFATAPLCEEHHKGKSGLHGRGSKAFCSAFRLPGETEYGLLVWVAEDMASDCFK